MTFVGLVMYVRIAQSIFIIGGSRLDIWNHVM